MYIRPLLIIGADGQLGTALKEYNNSLLRSFYNVDLTRKEIDLSDKKSISNAIKKYNPWMVINAAAYTDVDAAETDSDMAFKVNQEGPKHLANLCKQHNSSLIHISTDYVFDGTKGQPYLETDQVNPLNVYGQSKAAGEKDILDTGAQAMILRTSWVYSSGHKNFVNSVFKAAEIKAANKNINFKVVCDQIGSPTSADDLAETIFHILQRIDIKGWDSNYNGIFHAAGSGHASRYELAQEILAEAAKYGLPKPNLEKITSLEWPLPAERPLDTRLDCSKLKDFFGIEMPEWKSSVKSVVNRIYSDKIYSMDIQ